MGMFGQVQHVNTSTPRDTLFMDAAKHEITMPLGSVFLDESSKLSVELTEPGRADAMLTFLLDGKKVTPSIFSSKNSATIALPYVVSRSPGYSSK